MNPSPGCVAFHDSDSVRQTRTSEQESALSRYLEVLMDYLYPDHCVHHSFRHIKVLLCWAAFFNERLKACLVLPWCSRNSRTIPSLTRFCSSLEPVTLANLLHLLKRYFPVPKIKLWLRFWVSEVNYADFILRNSDDCGIVKDVWSVSSKFFYSLSMT